MTLREILEEFVEASHLGRDDLRDVCTGAVTVKYLTRRDREPDLARITQDYERRRYREPAPRKYPYKFRSRVDSPYRVRAREATVVRMSTPRVCLHCGAEFTATPLGGKKTYCSRRCAGRAWEMANRRVP